MTTTMNSKVLLLTRSWPYFGAHQQKTARLSLCIIIYIFNEFILFCDLLKLQANMCAYHWTKKTSVIRTKCHDRKRSTNLPCLAPSAFCIKHKRLFENYLPDFRTQKTIKIAFGWQSCTCFFIFLVRPMTMYTIRTLQYCFVLFSHKNLAADENIIRQRFLIHCGHSSQDFSSLARFTICQQPVW